MSDDGRHEGYLVPLFADGERGNGTTGGSIGKDQVAVGVGAYHADGTWSYETRPASEVTGWIVCCDCSTASTSRPTTWTGPVFTRVASPDREDLPSGQLHAADFEVAHVVDRAEVEEAVIELWRAEHANGAEALAEIQAVAIETARAKARLDAAVAEARRCGTSWTDIGRAAGINGHDAQERWHGRAGPSG